MKVFITKYALTTGIQEVDVELSPIHPKIVVYKNGGISNYFHKPFWHEKREDAINHANELRKKKIASIKKQLLKLETAFK